MISFGARLLERMEGVDLFSLLVLTAGLHRTPFVHRGGAESPARLHLFQPSPLPCDRSALPFCR